MDSLQTMVIKMAIGFSLRQLAKFGATTNWDTVKKDCYDRVNAIIPGTALDEIADEGISKVIDGIACVCQDTADLEALSGLMIDGKFKEALQFVKDALAKMQGKPAA